MWLPNAKLPRSAPTVLNGRCRVRLDMSQFSLGVVLRSLPARGRSVAFPVWVHWSDESRFLLRPTDSRSRVWRQRNTTFQDNHILDTTAFGGGDVTVWGCFSFDCKLDLYVLDGNRE
jgi:hypothetical protein